MSFFYLLVVIRLNKDGDYMAKKRYKKRKLRYKIKILSNFLLLILICTSGYYLYNLIINKSPILSITNKNNNLIIELDNNYDCLFTDEYILPDVDSNKWVASDKEYKCYTKFDNSKYIFLKKNNKIVYSTDDVIYLETLSDKVYMALNDKKDLPIKVIGNINNLDFKYTNSTVIDINKGKIISNSIGKTSIITKYNGTKNIIDVIVSDLIVSMPHEYDLKKKGLECNKYSEEESDILDDILKSRVNEVGASTRASAVSVARFLTLEFPYRINYFYENGRQTTNKVDGEGRYYHKGLYLTESKYSSLTGSTSSPKTWGCKLYSKPVSRYDNNGLDCSGFVSWVLLNAGFDPKDVGAGFADYLDLTDYGDVKRINSATINDIKVGDLLHSYAAGGHIGIIVGIDNDYFYVAQALWYDEVGVIITKYKKDLLYKSFPHVVLMDKYYINDGKLTNMWY